VRPPDISEDVPSEMVTQHAVKFLEEKENYCVDIAVTIQPTTPFCTSEDIDGCVKLLADSDSDSAASVCEVHERPEWMFCLDKHSYAKPFLGKKIKGEIGVSQSLSKLYMPNGGIYVTRRNVLLEEGVIFGKKVRFWIMPRERSVDIDEPIDFVFAEFLAKHNAGNEGGAK